MNAKLELSESKVNPKLIEIFSRLMAAPKSVGPHESQGGAKICAKQRGDSAKK